MYTTLSLTEEGAPPSWPWKETYMRLPAAGIILSEREIDFAAEDVKQDTQCPPAGAHSVRPGKEKTLLLSGEH